MKFAMYFMIVLEMLVCGSVLISVCMFIMLKAMLISSATVIIRAGGIWSVFISEGGVSGELVSE